MKLNIRKFAGGGTAFPWVSYNGGTDVNNTPDTGLAGMDDEDDDSSKSSSSSSGQLTDKGLMSLMSQLNGLPSDMNAIWQQLSQFYQARDLGLDIGSLSTQYIGALLKIKEANYHKQLFDKAYSTLEKNDGLSEYAVSSSGKVISINDEGKIEYNNLNDVLEGNVKGSLVTNQDLLKLRAESMAGNDNFITLAETGIGINKVADLIKGLLYALGTNERSHEGKISAKIQEGAQLLQALQDQGVDVTQAANGGLYEAKVVTKEQESKIKAALDYIYTTLPTNAKTILALHSGGERKSLELILERIASTTDKSVSTKLDVVEDKNGNKVKDSKSSSDGDDKMPNDKFTNIIRGEGGTNTTFTILNENGHLLNMYGVAYPNLSLSPEKAIHQTSLLGLMDYGYSSITKGGEYAVTFGANIVSVSDAQDIAVLNDQGAMRTILPIKRDPETGKIVPDLEFLQSHKDLVKLINSKGINDPEVVKSLLKEGIIDELTGLPNMNMFLSYLCINGLGTDRTFKNPQFVHEITDDSLDKNIELFEQSVYRSKEHNGGKEYKFDFDKDNWYDIFGHDSLYEGTIFIPLTENPLQSKLGSGVNIKEAQADNLELIYQNGENIRAAREMFNMLNSSSDLLLN